MKILLLILLLQPIPKDKQLHLFAGTEIGFATSVLTVEKKPVISFAYAVGSSALIGTAKELYDIKHGTPEVKDALFTVAGGVIGWGIVQGFKLIGKKIDKRHEKIKMVGSGYTCNPSRMGRRESFSR